MTGRRIIWILGVAWATLIFGEAAGVLPEGGKAEDPLVASAGRLMTGYAQRGAWINPWMAGGTGLGVSPSADQVLMAQVSAYDRALFDRGGWTNPYVPVPGYDAGNVLLAVLPGEGVSSGG